MKRTFELIAPCHFGLEAVLKKEILDLGYEISLVEDGRAVSYTHLDVYKRQTLERTMSFISWSSSFLILRISVALAT